MCEDFHCTVVIYWARTGVGNLYCVLIVHDINIINLI